MKVVRIGIIGSSFGGRVILPCLDAVEGLKVIAWASRNPKKNIETARQYQVPHLLESWQEMLTMDQVDLICVATPPSLHHEMVQEILKAKKNVLCEKPLAPNLKEAHKMAETAKQTSCFALVDHQLRFHPNFQKIKLFLKEKILGNPLHLELSYQTSVRRDPNILWNWWSDKAQGGGELNAIGSHFIDLLQWWFGKINWVSGHLDTFNKIRLTETGEKKNVTADEYTTCHLYFENNLNASVTLSSVSSKETQLNLQIVGTQGRLTLAGFDQLTFWDKEDKSEDVSQKDPYLTKPIIGLNSWRTSLVRFGEFLVKKFDKKAVETEGATFQDALETQKILEAIRLSHQEGRRVKVNQVKPL